MVPDTTLSFWAEAAVAKRTVPESKDPWIADSRIKRQGILATFVDAMVEILFHFNRSTIVAGSFDFAHDDSSQ
jgi:hypothetical protein